MILITDIKGCKHAVNTDAISRVSEPSTPAHWNGIHSYVHLFDGVVIEARQHVSDILRLIAEEIAEEKDTA